jgi:glycosyltransferase involved in cell wall biosynthesis
MEILFYNSFSLRVGSGPEHWLMDVTKRLEQLNNKITIIAPTCNRQEERFSYAEVINQLGNVNYQEFSCMKFPKLSSTPLPANLFGTYIRRPDVVYFLNGFALQDIYIMLDKLLTRTPVVCGLHGPLITTYGLHNMYVSHVLRRNLRSFDACHVLNPFYLDLLKAWDIKNVNLIPNGVDVKKYHPLPETCGSKKFKVLFIGRFAYEKGVDVLCKAIDLLNKSHELLNDVEFTLVGRGPLAPVVQQTADKYSNVKIERFVAEENLINVYNSHNIFVLPARFETFPLPPLEAQACGLPIITSDIPGTKEQIAKNTGAIVGVGNYKALAEAIAKYYLLWKNDYGAFKAQSVAARKNVLDNFELGKVVTRLNNMLSHVVREE